MSQEELDAMFALQQESFADGERQAEAESRNPFGRHRWIRLEQLQTASLNGQYAEIIHLANEDNRFGVRVQGDSKKKLVKRSNLVAVDDAETAKVCRIAASGEQSFVGGYIQDTRWPVSVLEKLPYEISPLSTVLGFPLRLSRVLPRSDLRERADWDNQWATWMMIDPKTGFAPDNWQSFVGPVVVWRSDGQISSDDMCLLNDFLDGLLDKYSEGSVVPEKHLTPEAWTRAKEKILENKRLNPHMQQYKDLNI
eukprot:TRINITY_DN26627_c0_g1_i1.p1 TRINITY_DN26627_c0_g1~~TRINITY_DN26627_c0_g1_i1.p1  ORF type:complete len:279 (+),score=35.50 TRINITY_DN26627_c0_g1_i1:81-839(+)